MAGCGAGEGRWLVGAASLLCEIALFLSLHQAELVLQHQAAAITENLNPDAATDTRGKCLSKAIED